MEQHQCGQTLKSTSEEINEVAFLSVSVKNKKYGKRAILSDISLSLPSSGIFLLTGDNGSGKTTLLNIMSGSDTDYEGSLCFNGHKVEKKNLASFRDSFVTFVPQDNIVFDRDPVLENVLIPYANKDKKKAKDLLASLRLEKAIDSPAGDLSEGEKQRLCLARAFYSPSRIVFLDEPTSSLDENNRDIILKFILKMKDSRLIVMTSHDSLPDYFMKEASVIRLEGGKAVFDGCKEKQPADEVNAAKLKTGSCLRNDAKSFAKHNSFILAVFALFTIVCSLCSSVFGTMCSSMSQANIEQFTFDNFMNSVEMVNLSPSVDTGVEPSCGIFAHTRFFATSLIQELKQHTYPDFGSINKIYIYMKEPEHLVPGMEISSFLNVDQATDIESMGFHLDKGRLPTSPGEYLISDVQYDYISSLFSAIGMDGRSPFELKVPFSDTETLSIVGTYATKDISSFGVRFGIKYKDLIDGLKLFDTYAYSEEKWIQSNVYISYSYGIETAIGLADENMVPDYLGYVLTKETRERLSPAAQEQLKSSASLDKEMVDCDANGNYALEDSYNWPNRYRIWSYTVCALNIFIEVIFIAAIWMSCHKYCLYERFFGVTKKRHVIAFCLVAGLSFLIAVPCGIIGGFVAQSVIQSTFSMTILDSVGVYGVISVPNMVLSAVIPLFGFGAGAIAGGVSSPSRLDAALREIKRR